MGQSSIVKNRIKRLQSYIGVNADGIIGPATLTALENRIFSENHYKEKTDKKEKNQDQDKNENKEELPKEHQFEYALKVSQKGLDLIVKYEISSKNYYKKFLSHPVWPGGSSGITIGIGYDLGYNTAGRIIKDWQGKIDFGYLQKLLKIAGKKGKAAEQSFHGVKNIFIPLESAKKVFYESSLPRYAVKTRNTYPEVENLFPDAQAALLSLIYNRGAAMKGSRRNEMAAIKPLVPNMDYQGIAAQIKAMKRLWEGTGLDGLLKRRDSEADLVLFADRAYEDNEIVRI